jgi:hypothetical protein
MLPVLSRKTTMAVFAGMGLGLAYMLFTSRSSK